MKKHLNRRQAMMAAGAATAGMAFTGSSEAQADVTMPEVWGEDFLHQWSPPDNVDRDLTPGRQHTRLSCAGYRMRRPEDGNYDAVVKSIRDAGFTACETGGGGWDGLTDSEIRDMYAALEKYDVEFYGIHAWANILEPDPERQRAAIRTYIENLELADRFGHKFMLVHSGGRSARGKDTPDPKNWTRESWEMSVRNTKEVLNATRGIDVDLAFEAVNSCNNNTPESHVQLKEDVGDDRVKVTLDPANMLYAGNMFRTTELINRCFELLGEDICYAHAKDKVWTAMMPTIEGVTLGEGFMDYHQYLAQLSRMQAPRCLLIEHLPRDQYEPSRLHLENVAREIGATIYS